MTTKQNCFVFKADKAGVARLSCGLPVRGMYFNRYVPLRDGDMRVLVAEEMELAQLAANQSEPLTEAMLGGGEGTFRRNAPGFVPRGGHNITILLVDVTPGMLCNEGKSEPHVTQGRFWMGAEGPNVKPIYQIGEHLDVVKAQLFQLEPGQFLFFCDAAYEVTVITAGQAGEEPVLRRATHTELADYVLHIADVRGYNSRTLQWCYWTLQELGCQAQQSAFARKYPDAIPKSSQRRR